MVVFNSRTRSEARMTVERGRIVETEFENVRKSACPSCPPLSEPFKSVCQSRTWLEEAYIQGWSVVH